MSQTRVIHVLHVDDEPDFAELAADMLEREDDRFTVETATSASEGLDRLAADDFDCIVSDYDMPGQNGIEFLETVREDRPQLPFILYTGKGSEEVASDAISAGITDYLQKKGGTDQYAVLANRMGNAVDRYRAQQARDRQYKAIESAQEGISILNEDGAFIYVNEAYADLYGYEPDEMVGEHWERIYSDEEVAVAREEILPTVAEEGYWHGETTGLRADGTTFPEDHVVSQTDSNELVCTVRDLSDRRQREHELTEYERIVETMGDGVYAINFDGVYIRLNEYVEDLTGYGPETIKEAGPSLIFDDEAIDQFEGAIRTLLTTETEIETVETELQTADDRVVPIEVNLTLLPDEESGYRGSVGVIRDISDRRERGRELERYETIVRAFPDEVYTADSEGYLTSDIPPAGEETSISGYPPEDLVGEHVSLVMDEEDAEKGEAIIQDLLKSDTEQTRSFEMDIVTREGDRIPHENHIALLPSDDGFRGTVGVLRNIADRKEREQRLQRQNDRLEKFTSGVSHDLRNPLKVAQGRLELAQDECDSDHLDDVAQAHERMKTLIDDLLTLAQTGDEVDATKAVALADVSEDCWATVVTTEATLVMDTEKTIEADSSRLKQLLENLFRNAVKHAGDDVTVTVGALNGRDGFYVADDGPGIPDDEREEVFEAGYSNADEGTGFGLNIVQEIAEAHGWDITVTNNKNGGARFEISGVQTDR